MILPSQLLAYRLTHAVIAVNIMLNVPDQTQVLARQMIVAGLLCMLTRVSPEDINADSQKN